MTMTEMVSKDELEQLARSDIPFVACKENNKYKVIVDESNVEDTLNAVKLP